MRFGAYTVRNRGFVFPRPIQEPAFTVLATSVMGMALKWTPTPTIIAAQ